MVIGNKLDLEEKRKVEFEKARVIFLFCLETLVFRIFVMKKSYYFVKQVQNHHKMYMKDFNYYLSN